MREFFNMSCGQAELVEASKASLGRDIIPIYSPTFWNMEEEALALLKKNMKTANDMIIVFGTGTSGIEATLNSILEPGDHFLVGHNGMFGEIMRIMVETVGGIPVVVKAPLGSPIDPAAIEKQLDADPSIVGIGVVHGETSVGVANPLAPIGRIARERDLLLVVDAISSFGSEHLDVDAWNIDLCVVNGQKCLGAPQGNTFVSVSPRAWKTMESRKTRIRGFYMNLLGCRDYLDMARVEQANWEAGANVHQFTLREAPHPASPSFVILKGVWESLRALEQEGLEPYIRRHQIAGKAVRAAVQAMGLETMCKDERFADNAVTAILLPAGIEDFQLRRHLFETYHVILGDANMLSWDQYTEQIGRQYVRLGTMGEAARRNKVLYGLFALGSALRDLGASIDVTAGIQAATSEYQEA